MPPANTAAPSRRLAGWLRLPLWAFVIADLALGLAPHVAGPATAWLPWLGLFSGVLATVMLLAMANRATLEALRAPLEWPLPARFSLGLLMLVGAAVVATVLASPLTPLALGQALSAGEALGLALLVSGFALQSAVLISDVRAAAKPA